MEQSSNNEAASASGTMRLNKVVCLGFTGDELEGGHWEELDDVTSKHVLVTNESGLIENIDADGLLGTGYGGIAYLTREAGQLKRRIYVDNLKNFLQNNPTNKVN